MKLFSLFSLVSGHSWIACTDYAEKNAAYYDHSKCRGWPRNAARFAPKTGTFGGDTGYDTRPQSTTSPCASRRSGDDYRDGHHHAVYYPGQQVVLAHPMKNHGAENDCTNPYIPDAGNWILAQPQTKPGQNDPNLGTFKQREIANLGVSPVGQNADVSTYPKPGFQNAPAFCEDTDKSLGTYSFNIPDDMEPGEYTFVWLWAFNSPQDYYSTCFEVTVVPDKQAREDEFAARGQLDFSLICDDGPTSTGDIGSTVGCDGTSNTPVSTKKPVVTPGPTNAPVFDGSYALVNQMTGKLILPGPDEPPKRREIHVKFFAECAEMVTPNFWYAKLSEIHDKDGPVRSKRSDGGQSDDEIHYVLIQDDQDDINRGYIGFHWAFDGGCKMLQKPAQIHVEDYLLDN